MSALKDDVPVAFQTAQNDYLSQIDDLSLSIEIFFKPRLIVDLELSI